MNVFLLQFFPFNTSIKYVSKYKCNALSGKKTLYSPTVVVFTHYTTELTLTSSDCKVDAPHVHGEIQDSLKFIMSTLHCMKHGDTMYMNLSYN